MMRKSNTGGLNAGRLLFAALALACATAAAGAEEARRWELVLGGGAYSSAAYDGSDEQFAALAPYVRAEYERGNLSLRLSLTDGLTAMYFDLEKRFLSTLEFGWGAERNPETYSVLGASRSHDASTEKLLAGSPSVETLMRLEGKFGWVSPAGVIGVALEYRPTAVEEGDAENCFLPSLFYLLPLPVGESTELIVLARLRFMDDAFSGAWYAQGADAGIRDAEIAAQAEHTFARHWKLLALAGFTRYLGDAASSPYTATPNKYTAGVFALYSF